MRNMSFMLTTKQVYSQTKNVTRRLGWNFLKAGDKVMACEKCQGLKKGKKIVKMKPISVASKRWEPLRRMTDDLEYGRQEVILEGFPEMSPQEFVEMFCREMGVTPSIMVNRIEFTYIEKGEK